MSSAILLAQAGRAENLSIFDPASPQAGAIRDLAFVVLAITVVIFLLVEGVLLYSIVRFRHTKTVNATEPPQVYGSHAIEIAWTVAPALIVLVLILVVARTEWEVQKDPPAPKAGDNALYVTVAGRQWWWEYRYDYYNGDKLNFVTANELHVPASDADASGVQRPVYLTLLSADVCHSFWVPRLAGKTDLLPGRTNKMWFQTAERGLFLGQCAEFCGTQHAKMLIRVNVDAPADFEKWYKNEQGDARTPVATNVQAGQAMFFKQSCVNCHRIQGTTANGTYAPDLTHLMSRQTLASGIMPNTAENLRLWVADPQKIKPGCLMPAFGLSSQEVDGIVAYLRSLE
ncbi:MAG TPA: cytochrome c oxidase subunit II [Gemmataceae bacterium]|nr:cytochrome c oxidase subunit II [Gemmataceae bacterium]